MTIIAANEHIMVADSFSWSGGISYPAADPKIVRAPDGSLVGALGPCTQVRLLLEWALAGMDFDNLPKLREEDSDDPMRWVWLRPDHTLWHGTQDMQIYRVTPPFVDSSTHAATFTDGLLAAGLPVEEAVRIATTRCAYIGGPLQIECLVPRKNLVYTA